MLNIYISDNGIDPDSMALATVDEMKSIFPKLEEFLKIKAIFLATWGNGAVKVIMFNQIYKILKLLLQLLYCVTGLIYWPDGPFLSCFKCACDFPSIKFLLCHLKGVLMVTESCNHICTFFLYINTL